MSDKLFTADDFTSTEKFDDAEQKAKFANQFVAFVKSDFDEKKFPKWFYTRLSMVFGHIALYNRENFYGFFFHSIQGKVKFLRTTLQYPCYGAPTHTYCDVEKALQKWVIEQNIMGDITSQQANEMETKRLDTLRQLISIYPDIAQKMLEDLTNE